MSEFTPCNVKQSLLSLIAEQPTITQLLDQSSIINPDEQIGVCLFPYLKTNWQEQDTKTYIGLAVNFPSLGANKLYKNCEIVVMISSHYTHLQLSSGATRTDLIAQAILDQFNGTNVLGFTLKLKADIEESLPPPFYGRKLLFQCVVANDSKRVR